MRAHTSLRLVGLGVGMLVLVAASLAGCGVDDGGSPRRVDVGLGLDEAATTTSTTSAPTTTTTVAVTASTTLVEGPSSTAAATSTTVVATESVPIFFLSGSQLTSISIPLTSPATLGQVMTALQKGPFALGPPGTGLRSAIPFDVPPIGVTDDGNGIAAVDLPSTFFDTIPAIDQRLAIAQIVLSLTNQRGIGSVRFTRFGDPIGVILGSGEQSEPGQPVTKAEYRSLVIGGDALPATTGGPGTTGPGTTGPDTTGPGTTGPGTTGPGTTVTVDAPPPIATVTAPAPESLVTTGPPGGRNP